MGLKEIEQSAFWERKYSGKQICSTLLCYLEDFSEPRKVKKINKFFRILDKMRENSINTIGNGEIDG